MEAPSICQLDLGKTAHDAFAVIAIAGNIPNPVYTLDWNDLPLVTKLAWIKAAEAIRDKVHE